MQLLVYIFIGILAVAVGATGYFGLAFTVIEAILASAVAFSVSITMLERSLRARSEARLEKGIDDLSRLLSTDAQAGQVLNQRINALAKVDSGNRLESLEADISVLGTVMRQVAEAVSELETRTEGAAPATVNGSTPKGDFGRAASYEVEPEPVIPVEVLRQAMEDDRLVFHMQPIITLPRRQTHGYDLVPRLMLEDGEIADAPDFMPSRGGDDIIRKIERRGIEEAVTIVRRARTSGQPAMLFVPISKTTLSDESLSDRLIALFDANRVISQSLMLRISDTDWRSLSRSERAVADEIAGKGIGFSLTNANSLRVDFGNLSDLGVASIRIDATRFINDSTSFTDFHASDVADYVSRFGVEVFAENIRNEQQILTMLEDGIKYAQGPHIALPAPVRPDLLVRREEPNGSGQRARGA